VTDVGLSDDAYVADTRSFAIFFLLKCGEPEQHLRATSVWGDFEVAADAIDTTGGIYRALPMPTGLQELSQAINGTFQGVEFALSGVGITSDFLQLATIDRDLVNGAAIHVGLMDLDDRQQPIGGVDWLFEAQAGWPKVQRSGSGARAIRTMSLPATAAFKDRHLAPIAYLTPQGQRSRSPTDAFCDNTPAYSAISTITWKGE
jgi:hypothetical protein